MSGFAIRSYCDFLSAPIVKVQLRTMPRGSWKWQDAVSVRLVRCPRNESPDCRRRGHELIGVVARKVAVGTKYTRQLIGMAQERAADINAASTAGYAAVA